MIRKLALVWLSVAFLGCVTPVTRRLDEANMRAADIEEQLHQSTMRLAEANAILVQSQKDLREANQSLMKMEGYMQDMDKKFGTVELGFRKMFGIKEKQEEN